MARVRAKDYDDRRETIVDAAAKLIADHGFHGASMAQIAKACGMTKPLLYHYFPAKEDVLLAIMEDHVDDLYRTAQKIAQSAAKPAQKLQKLTREFMARYVDAQARHKVLLNELNALPQDKRARVIADQRAVLAYVFAILCEIDPRLKNRPDLKVPAAMLVMGMLNWTHTWFDPKGPISAETYAQMVTDLTLNGVNSLIKRGYIHQL